MINLPKWRLTSPYPAFLDGESGTAIEMTAKVYGAMNGLIDEYNAFVQETVTRIDEFEATTKEEQVAFETALRQEFQDFIDVVQLRLDGGATQASIEEINQAKNNAITEIENALQGVLDGTY